MSLSICSAPLAFFCAYVVSSRQSPTSQDFTVSFKQTLQRLEVHPAPALPVLDVELPAYIPYSCRPQLHTQHRPQPTNEHYRQEIIIPQKIPSQYLLYTHNNIIHVYITKAAQPSSHTLNTPDWAQPTSYHHMALTNNYYTTYTYVSHLMSSTANISSITHAIRKPLQSFFTTNVLERLQLKLKKVYAILYLAIQYQNYRSKRGSSALITQAYYLLNIFALCLCWQYVGMVAYSIRSEGNNISFFVWREAERHAEER